MRKIMMVALFSVLSLSACAVEDPTQADESADEIDGSKLDSMEPAQSAEPTEMVQEHGIDGRMTEMTPVLEATHCEANSDCYSNVCDLEKHLCRQFPF
jgi:hypothetical protein